MPYHAETIVVGCGNILFKDDGFGPMVIHKLEEYFEDNHKTVFPQRQVLLDRVLWDDAGWPVINGQQPSHEAEAPEIR